MKLLFAVLMLFCASAGWTADQPIPPAAAVLKGEVLEVQDVEIYSYLRLKTADKTDDLLVTTMDQTKVGDVVAVKGVVRIDKDFGAGYAYKVLVEEATLQK